MNTLSPIEAALAHALREVKDPLSGASLVQSGRLQSVRVSADGRAAIVIEAPPQSAAAFEDVRAQAEAIAKTVKGVTRATAVLTAPPTAPASAQPRQAQGLDHVSRIIAIASAKGGVGKSTFAVNFSCALAQSGLRVGLADLDVYGPSLPTLLGLSGARPEAGDGKRMRPIAAFGLQAMSVGFLVDASQPMVWRGAMATQAVRQILDEVMWGTQTEPLDVLVLDMPPGTGDIHLTVAQRLALDGAIIVSTPQEMALADVRRGAAMFEKTRTPVIGVVENMAWLATPDGGRLHIFGEGGARRTAEAIGAPFLGDIPIDIALRESADAGRPFVAEAPVSDLAQLFRQMAQAALVNAEAARRTPPTIRFV